MKSRTLSFSAIPFLRLLIPFTGGVLLFHVYPFFLISLLIPALLSLLGLSIFLFFRKRESLIRTYSFLTFGFFGALATGALNTSVHTYKSDNTHAQTGFWTGEVKRINSNGENTLRCDITLKAFSPTGIDSFNAIKKEARIYIRKRIADSLSCGDHISFHCTLNPPYNNGNPGEFDYARWLLQKGFSLTGFVDSTLWQSTSNPDASLIARINRISDQLKDKIRTLLSSPEQANLLIALLLGDKTELQEEQKALFRHNGISHLLAVSGFHVGLIFSILLSCFFYIPHNTKTGKYIRALALIILWFYALLTGATPSVLRATFMITLFVAGGLINRKGFTLNTLCFAALCLLIIQPYTLFDIGFQLSFVSVAGIIISQTMLSDWLNCQWQYQWLRYPVNFVTVCIAAQIATLPLTLYYFGSFSPYFLIGNLIAIPIIYLILFLSIPYLCLFLCSGITCIYANKALEALFSFLSQMLGTVESLPFAYPDAIRPEPEQVILLYAMFLSVLIGSFYKSRKALPVSLILLTLLFIPFKRWKQDVREQIIILNNTPGNTIFACHKSSYAVISSSENANEKAMAENYFGIKNPKQMSVTSSISVSGQKILFLDTDSLRFAGSQTPLEVDFLVLKRGCKGNLTKINQLFSAKTIILDGSLTPFWRKKWLTEAKEAGIICYDMKEHGAFSYFFH